MDRSLQATLSKLAVSIAAITCGVFAMAQRGPGHSPPPPPAPPVQAPLPKTPSPQAPVYRPHGYTGTNPGPARASASVVESDRRANNPSRSDSDKSGERVSKREAAKDDNLVRRVNHRARSGEARIRERQHSKPADLRATRRLMNFPTRKHSRTRCYQIFNDIQLNSRKGFIPVTAVPSDISELTDYAVKRYAGTQAGWKGYGFIIPPKESLTVNLSHSNRAWFSLYICDKWGSPVPGGLSSLHPHRAPRLTCKNPGNEASAVYFIVDDPGWWSYEENPYTLEIKRSWNPALFPEDLSVIVSGIWGPEQSINARFRRPMVVMPGFK